MIRPGRLPHPPHETPTREGPHYPQSGTWTWGAFAGLVFELGGYNDIQVYGPWTGKGLHVPDAALARNGGELFDWPTALRRVADAMERTGWTGE